MIEKKSIHTFLLKLDDRIKIWMTFVAGTAAIYCVDWRTETAVLLMTLILCWFSGAWRGVLVFSGILLIFATGICGIRFLIGPDSFPGSGLLVLIVKFGPMCAMMVFAYKTINNSRFLRSLERLKVPERFIVPFGVCLRYLPSVTEEYGHIKNAVRFRGIEISPKNMIFKPFHLLEYVLVPLLMRSLVIGTELARAAMTRGIDYPGKKTSYHIIRCRRIDYLCGIAWTVILLAIIYIDHRIYTAATVGVL